MTYQFTVYVFNRLLFIIKSLSPLRYHGSGPGRCSGCHLLFMMTAAAAADPTTLGVEGESDVFFFTARYPQVICAGFMNQLP